MDGKPTLQIDESVEGNINFLCKDGPTITAFRSHDGTFQIKFERGLYTIEVGQDGVIVTSKPLQE